MALRQDIRGGLWFAVWFSIVALAIIAVLGFGEACRSVAGPEEEGVTHAPDLVLLPADCVRVHCLGRRGNA